MGLKPFLYQSLSAPLNFLRQEEIGSSFVLLYRTSSPLEPLPCFLSLTNTIIHIRVTGIGDRILTMGNWLNAASRAPFWILHSSNGLANERAKP